MGRSRAKLPLLALVVPTSQDFSGGVMRFFTRKPAFHPVFGAALIFLLSGVFFTFSTYAQENTPDIAWTVNGELWLAGDSIPPFSVVTENACCAVFSPQGTRLAYVSADESGQMLVILDTDAPQTPREVESSDFPANALLGYLRWQGEHILWLNTFQQPARKDVNLLETDWSLWRVDAESGEVTSISDEGRGGVAYPAPDGELVAVAYPGVYGEASAVITLFSADGAEVARYEYPAVSSASHLAWLPEIHWINGGIRFAVPDPDLVYAFENPLPPTQLLELHPERDVAILGEIPAVYPARVLWSPDRTQIAYITRGEGDSSQKVVLRNVIDGQEQIILENAALGTDLIEWNAQLVINTPDQGLLLWSDSMSAPFPEVYSIARTRSGELVMANRTEIVLLKDGDFHIIQDNVNGYDVILAGGIHE